MTLRELQDELLDSLDGYTRVFAHAMHCAVRSDSLERAQSHNRRYELVLELRDAVVDQKWRIR